MNEKEIIDIFEYNNAMLYDVENSLILLQDYFYAKVDIEKSDTLLNLAFYTSVLNLAVNRLSELRKDSQNNFNKYIKERS